MKIFPLFLVGSLILNAALVVLIVTGSSDDTTPALSLPTHPVEPAAIRTADRVPDANTWSALQAGDLAAQRDRLNAEGFPPSFVRTILAAQIRERFAARRKALEAAQASIPFWKNPSLDPKIVAEGRALTNEEQKALRESLGLDPDNPATNRLRREFPNLSADKVAQLIAIREHYDEQRRDLTASPGSSPAPDESEKFAALAKAMHAEFARVLTPAELEDYDLRTSNTANDLRRNLTLFDATEAEFRALYRLKRSYAGQNASYTAVPAEDIKAALGDARYADYQRATNDDYRRTSLLVARLALPPEIANQIYAVQQESEQRSNAIRRLPPAERTPPLTALAAEAQAKVAQLLGGSRGMEAYKQSGGSWLQDLVPRPVPARPATN